MRDDNRVDSSVNCVNSPSSRSIHGALTGTPGSFSSAYDISTIALPASRASFHFFRVKSSSEAKNVKSICASSSRPTGCTSATSSWTRSSWPNDSSSSSSLISVAGKLRSSSTSLSSLPLSEAAPTIATRKRFCVSVFIWALELHYIRDWAPAASDGKSTLAG